MPFGRFRYVLPVEDGVVIYGYLGFDPITSLVGWHRAAVARDRALLPKGSSLTSISPEGQSGEKRRFATHESAVRMYFLVKRSARNTTLIVSHLMMDHCSHWLGSTLDRVGAKRGIKRLLLLACSPGARTLIAPPRTCVGLERHGTSSCPRRQRRQIGVRRCQSVRAERPTDVDQRRLGRTVLPSN